LNTIVEQLDIPQLLKSGILTLVLKKNKDRRNSSNYRGIAVTKIFTKIFQSVLKAELIRTLNPLQRGFTEAVSSLLALSHLYQVTSQFLGSLLLVLPQHL
jgi:hypothetical protein